MSSCEEPQRLANELYSQTSSSLFPGIRGRFRCWGAAVWWMMNIDSCGFTTQAVYISLGLNNIFKAFFTVSINLEGEHFELSLFFAHFSATFSGHQTYSVCNSCKTNLWAKKIDPEQPNRTVCHKRLKSLQWCWNQRFGKYLIRSNIRSLERFISDWQKRVKVT